MLRGVLWTCQDCELDLIFNFHKVCQLITYGDKVTNLWKLKMLVLFVSLQEDSENSDAKQQLWNAIMFIALTQFNSQFPEPCSWLWIYNLVVLVITMHVLATQLLYDCILCYCNLLMLCLLCSEIESSFHLACTGQARMVWSLAS